MYYALLVEAYGAAGHTEEGLDMVAEALALVEKTGFRFFEAELRRLQGELLLKQTAPDNRQAETCLHRALEFSRSQQAKSLELRTAMSLSRLWHRQGKKEEAHLIGRADEKLRHGMVYLKYSIESISFIYFIDCILGMRNHNFTRF
jgi:predicted ATPase